MRKFFCSISIFLILSLLSAGYYYSSLVEKPQKSREQILTEMKETEVQASGRQKENDYGLFYLKEKNGCVVVYESDKKTVYEPTTIKVSLLPEKIQKKVKKGMYIKTLAELYGFLENYSS